MGLRRARMPFHSPVRVGGELWQYYVGFARVFNAPRMYGAGGIRKTGDMRRDASRKGFVNLPGRKDVPANGVGLATLRLDGYVSLDAGPRGGTMTTKPFTFEGTQLIVNARALGHMTVEVLDAAGQPIQGVSRVSIAGDSVRHLVAWDGLGQLAGQPIRLRFYLWNAELYAFGFAS